MHRFFPSFYFVSSGACLGIHVVVRPSAGQWPVLSGIVYVVMREWYLACTGVLDPCSEQRQHLRLASSFVGTSLCSSAVGYPVLHTYREGILSAETIPSSSCVAAPCGLSMWGGSQGSRRVSHRIHLFLVFGQANHVASPVASGTEHHVGTRPRPPIATTMRSTLFANDGRLGLRPCTRASFGAAPPSARDATWLILPVVICLSQRLSHACVSMN